MIYVLAKKQNTNVSSISNFLRDELLPTELPEAGLKELVKMAYK